MNKKSVDDIKKQFIYRDLLGLGFIALVWGGAWPISALGLKFCDMFLLGALRCLLASGSLFIWRALMAKKTVQETKTNIPIKVFIISGIFWVGFPVVMMYWALYYVPSGLGSILHSTIPLFVALLSHFLLKEQKITMEMLIGVVLGFVGIVIMYSDNPITTSEFKSFLAAGAILLGSLSIAFAQIYSFKNTAGVNQIEFNMKIHFFGGLLILPFAFVTGVPFLIPNLTLVGIVLFLGIFGSAIPNALYINLYKRVNLVLLSMITYVIPIVAVITGMIVLKESLTLFDTIGSILVLSGVLTATQLKNIIQSFK
jgi:drug/metabolite transporter (DMT)-like permease